MSTFVSVGNATQPFPRLLEAVGKLASEMPQPVMVQVGNNAFTNPACRTVDFLSMDSFVAHIKQADLLILHAGAGTVINAVQAGKVPVVAPRKACYGELIDDHQLEFARALATADKVVLVEDMGQLASAVREVRSRQSSRFTRPEQPALIAKIESLLSGYARLSGR